MIPHSFTTNAVQIQQYAASLTIFCFRTNKFPNSSEPPGVKQIPKVLDFHSRFNSLFYTKEITSHHEQIWAEEKGPNDPMKKENRVECDRLVGESSINKASSTDALKKRTGLQMDPLLYKDVANS